MFVRATIACWGDGFAFGATSDTMAWIKSFCPDRKVVAKLEARLLRVYPSSLGRSMSEAGRDNGDVILQAKDMKLDLVRFQRHEVRMMTQGVAGDNLTYQIPADHRLPWPKLRECEAYDCMEVMVEELHTRMMSWLQSGDGSHLFEKPNDRLLFLMGGTKIYGETLKRARADHARLRRAA